MRQGRDASTGQQRPRRPDPATPAAAIGAPAHAGRRASRAIRWFALAGLPLAAAAAANEPPRPDVLVGPDGERIPGTLVAERDGWIEFESSLLGRLKVRSDRVRVERTAAAPPAGGNDPATPAGAESTATSVAVAPTVDAPTTDPAASAATADEGGDKKRPLRERVGLVPDGWSQRFGLSARSTGGSREDDETRMTIDYNAKRGAGANKTALDLRYSGEREDGETTEDDWRVNLRHEYEFGRRRFHAGSFIHRGDLDDGERKLSRALTVGTGWRLVATDDLDLRLAPGYALVKVRDQRGPGSGHGPALYARVAWRVVGPLKFSATTLFAASSGALGRNFVDANARIDWPLTEHLGTALTWDYTRNEFNFNIGDSSKLQWLVTWTP